MSTFVLKIIALVTMVIDHSGAVFESYGNVTMLRAVGRIAFPIYVFLIAQGAKHTKDMKKYLGRLLLFVFISELPFDLAFARGYSDRLFSFQWLNFTSLKALRFLETSHQNVFFTLFLGALAIYIHQQIVKLDGNKILGYAFSIVNAFALAYFADILNTDYGFTGVAAIYFAYLAGNKFAQAGIILFMCYSLYFYPANQIYFYFSLAAIACILLYNNKPGKYKLRWFFYIAYPAHIFILYVARLIVIGVLGY